MKTLGLVTSFVDPQKDLKRVGGRDAAVYLRLFEELHKTLPLPLVIRVCPEHVGAILSLLVRHPVEAERHVVVEPFLIDRNVKRLAEISDLEPFENQSPESKSRTFAVACYGKVDAVVDSLDLLKTSHVGWIDFGIAHIARLPSKEGWREIESRIPNRVKLVQMRATSEKDIEDLREFYRLNRGRMDAGLFTAARPEFFEFRIHMNAERKRMLGTGRYVLEEQLMASLSTRMPDLFEYAYADYSAALVNFVGVRDSADKVLANLEHCRATENYVEGERVYRALYNAASRRTIQLDEQEWAHVLSDGYICEYFLEPEEAEFTARLVSALYNYGNAAFRHAVLSTPLPTNLCFSNESLSAPSWTKDYLLNHLGDLHVWSRCL